MVFGDVVGKIGRKGLAKCLPELKARYAPDLTIANAENLAHGRGITPQTIQELADSGVDVFTSGHHVWENPTGVGILDQPEWQTRLVRPANVDPNLQGKGWTKLNIKGQEVVIVNLQGQLFMSQESSSPFLAFDRIWKDVNPDLKHPLPVLVDIHGEATSEKRAFGHYVDGRAALVYGTHTHVPTSDAQILANGTAYVTDVGMVGAQDSVIGFEKNSSIKRFLDLTKAPYDLLESGKVEVNGLVIKFDCESQKVVGLDRIREIVDI